MYNETEKGVKFRNERERTLLMIEEIYGINRVNNFDLFKSDKFAETLLSAKMLISKILGRWINHVEDVQYLEDMTWIGNGDEIVLTGRRYNIILYKQRIIRSRSYIYCAVEKLRNIR